MTSKADLAVLTNFIAPYRYPVFKRVAETISTRFLIDTPMEENRRWGACHNGLDVEVVPGLHFQTIYRHSTGFKEIAYYHLPLGLLWRLFKLKPRTIWTAELGLRTALACLYSLFSPSTRVVCAVEGTPHTDASRGGVRAVWRRLLLQHVDSVWALNSGARDLVLGYGLAKEHVKVSYPASGFGPPKEAPKRDILQRRRLLFAGRFVELKGIRPFLSSLVAVCARHRETGVEIRFVGYGPEEPWIKSVQTPSNLTIRVLPPVELEQMPTVLSDCGILVFPTLADVWGLVTNEAMAYSMPVLGSVYAQSVCDLVREGVTGWRFHPDDQAEMERAIYTAISATPDRLEAMGAAARETVLSLTPEKFGDEMLQAIYGPTAKATQG